MISSRTSIAQPTCAAAFAAMALAGLVLSAPVLAGSNTTFDLGFDVDASGVVRTPAGVRAFMASLAPSTRRATEGACTSFLSEPSSARSMVTLSFCSLALTGSYDTRTFSRTVPSVRPPRDNPILQSN